MSLLVALLIGAAFFAVVVVFVLSFCKAGAEALDAEMREDKKR